MLWVDVRHMPWRSLYANTPFFNQFRYPTRMLIFGALALVVLAAAGLDALWQRVRTRTLLLEMSVPGVARWALVRLGLVALAGVMIWSVSDVYLTNGRYARTRDPYLLSYDIAAWLRVSDPSTFYVGNPNGWHGSLISSGLRYVDAWYGFSLLPPLAGASNRRPVFARPKYAVLHNDRPPDRPDAMVVGRFETHTVYRYPHSLPFAFTVEDARLSDDAGGRELASEDVTALAPSVPGPNNVQVTTGGSAGSTLVVLMSAYPGWRLLVDGQAQALRNVGGYLAADVLRRRPSLRVYLQPRLLQSRPGDQSVGPGRHACLVCRRPACVLALRPAALTRPGHAGKPRRAARPLPGHRRHLS